MHRNDTAPSTPPATDNVNSVDDESEDVTTAYRWAPIPEGLLYDTEVSHLAVRLYGVLMRRGLTPRTCHPSIKWLAERFEVSPDTIRRAKEELRQRGWITEVARWRPDGGQTSNGYHLHERRTPPAEAPPAPLASTQPPPSEPSDHPPRAGASQKRAIEREPLKESAAPNVAARRSSDETANPSPPLPGMSSGTKAARRASRDEMTQARNLCDVLARFVGESSPDFKRPKVTAAWVTSMDRLLRIDERTPEQVTAAIEWVFTNPAGEFWIPNIRSPRKLREHYPRLQIEAKRAADVARGKPKAASAKDIADRTYRPYVAEDGTET